MSQQWLHYEKGDFSTLGFPGDSLYPTKEIETTSNYSRPAESKQELLCGNARASKDSKRKDDKVDPSPPPAPIFTYSLPGRTTTQVHHHHHVFVLTLKIKITQLNALEFTSYQISSSICLSWTNRPKWQNDGATPGDPCIR